MAACSSRQKARAGVEGLEETTATLVYLTFICFSPVLPSPGAVGPVTNRLPRMEISLAITTMLLLFRNSRSGWGMTQSSESLTDK